MYRNRKHRALAALATVASIVGMVAVIPAHAAGDCDPLDQLLAEVPGADAARADCVPEDEFVDLTVAPASSGDGLSAQACIKTTTLSPSVLFGGGYQDRDTGSETDVHDGWDGNNARLYIQNNQPVHGRTEIWQLRGRGAAIRVSNLSSTAMFFDMSLPWAFKADVYTAAGISGWPAMGLGFPAEGDGSVDWRVDFEEDGPSGLFEINQRNGRTHSNAQFQAGDADWNNHNTSGTVSRSGYGVPGNTSRDYVWNMHMEATAVSEALGAGWGRSEFNAKDGTNRLGVSPIKLTLTSDHCWV